MLYYILRRLALIIPTLLGIVAINFFLIQMAPGGPVEQFVANYENSGDAYMERVGTGSEDLGQVSDDQFDKKNYGLSPEILAEIEEMYGFDKPIYVRFWEMVKGFALFDFGESFFKADSVVDLVKKTLPVSITIGLWSTLITYLVCVPLGIKRALNRGSKFDVYSGITVVVASTIPAFLLAIVLLILFAGGSYFQWFPLRGLHSIGFEDMTLFEQIIDYFHHITLPVIAMTVTGFAGLTLLTRNSFLDELSKQYVETAKAKGLTQKAVLYKHVFRNAMLIVISGFPSAFIGIFFAGSLLIETIFSLQGMGLLGFEATMQRDYPVMFSTLYVFTLIGLVTSLLSDIVMMFVDPRIDFKNRKKV